MLLQLRTYIFAGQFPLLTENMNVAQVKCSCCRVLYEHCSASPSVVRLWLCSKLQFMCVCVLSRLLVLYMTNCIAVQFSCRVNVKRVRQGLMHCKK